MISDTHEPMRPRAHPCSEAVKIVCGYRYRLSGHRRGKKGRTLRSWRVGR